MRRSILALAAFGVSNATALAADSPQPLAGHWRIAEIDGRAPLHVDEDAGKPRTPRFSFGERSYGGTSGCNFLGGLKIERDGRLYTYPGPQTQMACVGPLGDQETAIDALFRSAPAIAHTDGAVILTGGGHTMRLVAEESTIPVEDAPEAWQGPGVVGQRYELHQFDGDSLNRRPAPRIEFEKGKVTLTHLCPKPVSGPYVPEGKTLHIALFDACDTALKYFSKSLTTVSGPNGELLLAGPGHWIAGDNLRRDRPK
jgi:heat shock protein HslJ